MAGQNRGAAPIAENDHVKDLLFILRLEKDPRLYELTAFLGQISDMQKQLDTAVQELSAMRRDLAEMEKRNHPIKNTLQKAVIGAQHRVLELRDKLDGLKNAVIDGCKNAVAAFQEKGIAALDRITKFFKVRLALWEIHKTANQAAHTVGRAIDNIKTAGARFHEAGRNLKNAGRALSGKEAIQETKPNGKTLKALTTPFRAAHACFKGIENHAALAVNKLNRLEEKAAARKPPIKEVIQECTEKAERENRATQKRKTGQDSPEL